MDGFERCDTSLQPPSHTGPSEEHARQTTARSFRLRAAAWSPPSNKSTLASRGPKNSGRQMEVNPCSNCGVTTSAIAYQSTDFGPAGKPISPAQTITEPLAKSYNLRNAPTTRGPSPAGHATASGLAWPTARGRCARRRFSIRWKDLSQFECRGPRHHGIVLEWQSLLRAHATETATEAEGPAQVGTS